MKLKLTSLVVAIAFSRITAAQTSADVIAYINTYKSFAMSEMQRTGIPASIILAQGLHETQAGTSELVKKSNNHFGIKCKDDWKGLTVYHDDDAKGECLRSYASPLDSYKDHSDFLRNSARYAALFKLNPMNYEAWAYGLKKAGYATNPKYPQILIQFIKDYNLQQYTLIAMGKLQPSDEILVGGDNNKTLPQDTQPITAPVSEIVPARTYPTGEFLINNTRVVFEKSGTSLLSVSDEFDIPLSRLLEFNDLNGKDVLTKDQLIFLQRKRKTGANEFHFVQPGENMYDICQAEAIRYENILSLNLLSEGEMPAVGEKLYLRSSAPSKPLLNTEKDKTAGIAYRDTVNVESKVNDTAASAPVNIVTHIVQAKETLYSISKKYGVEIEKIQKWNKLDSMDLKTGQELIIYKN